MDRVFVESHWSQGITLQPLQSNQVLDIAHQQQDECFELKAKQKEKTAGDFESATEID